MFTIIKVTRKQMIKELSYSMFDAMESDADYRLLICFEGHKGFKNLRDEDLLIQYRDYIELEDDEILRLEEEN